jgi:phytoene synthase
VGRPAILTVEHAREVTRRYARTFYFASHVLPDAKRDAAFVVYAFCRQADNLTDVHREDSERIPDAERHIALLREELDAVFAVGDQPTRWTALRETVRAFRIPREYFVPGDPYGNAASHYGHRRVLPRTR